MNRLATAAACGLIAVGLSACGGGGGSAGSSSGGSSTNSGGSQPPPPPVTLAKPTLPDTPYAYADEGLDLPSVFIRQPGDNEDRVPENNPTTDLGATLGRVLFYDKRLSATDSLACASCHQQSHGFSDPAQFSTGFQGGKTKRHAMALVNARYNNTSRYFADGRAAPLEDAVLVPIVDPVELGNSLPQLETKLAATDFYPPLFEAAFGSPAVTQERIARALAQFIRSMVSYRAKYDRAFYFGDDYQQVFTAQEIRGFTVFLDSGCQFCHQAQTQSIAWPANNGLDAVITDRGIGDGTFRASSLRNIAVTAPYMHDGRFATLREVIDHYDHGVELSEQLDGILKATTDGGLPLVARRLDLSEESKLALEAFLNTLTDNELLNDPKFSNPFPE